MRLLVDVVAVLVAQTFEVFPLMCGLHMRPRVLYVQTEVQRALNGVGIHHRLAEGGMSLHELRIVVEEGTELAERLVVVVDRLLGLGLFLGGRLWRRLRGLLRFLRPWRLPRTCGLLRTRPALQNCGHQQHFLAPLCAINI